MESNNVERGHPEWVNQAVPAITKEDREWMVALGCDWPRTEREQTWLDETNQLLATGSALWPEGDKIERASISKARRRLMRRIFGLTPSDAEDLFFGTYLLPSHVGIAKVKEMTSQAIAADQPIDNLTAVLGAVENAEGELTVDEYFDEIDEDLIETIDYPDLHFERERKERIQHSGPRALWRFRQSLFAANAPLQDDNSPGSYSEQNYAPGPLSTIAAATPAIVLSSPERIANRNERYGSISSLAPKDKDWLAVYGLRWPGKDDEENWLEHVNEHIAQGSVDGRYLAPEQRAVIYGARIFIHSLFTRLNSETGGVTELHQRHLSTDIFLGTLKELATISDITDKWHQYMAGYSSPAAIREHKKIVQNLGYDVDTILNAPGGLSVLSMSEEGLRAKIRTIVAAGRALGFSQDQMMRLTEQNPSILTNRTERLRLLARIALAVVEPVETLTDEIAARFVSASRNSLTSLIATYLGADKGKISLSRLKSQATAVARTMPADAQLGLIQSHADDPLIARYLETYPINDHERVAYAYQRYIDHQAGIDHRIDTIDIDWTGWSIIGDPAEPTYDMYKRAIRVPELSSEEYDLLDQRISEGSYAARRIHELYVQQPYSVPEITEDEIVADDGMRARRTLIARHLGMVVKYAQSKSRFIETQIEFVSTGNVALVKAAMRYKPGAEPFREVATQALTNALGPPGKVVLNGPRAA